MSNGTARLEIGFCSENVSVVKATVNVQVGSTTPTYQTYRNGAPTYQSVTGTKCLSTCFGRSSAYGYSYFVDGYDPSGDAFTYYYNTKENIHFDYVTAILEDGWQPYDHYTDELGLFTHI